MTFIRNTEYYAEVRKGNIPGESIVQKFGAKQDIGTTLTPVTTSGFYPTPTALTALEIVSDDVNDTFLGTGMRTVRLGATSDINGNFTEQVIEVELNGTTAVALPNSVWRVYRMKGLTSGTYATSATPSHSSDITLQESGGGAVWHVMGQADSFGLGQSEIAVYTIPLGKTGYLLSKKITVEGTKTADVLTFVREQANIVVAPFGAMNVKELERGLAGTVIISPKSPLLAIPEGSDVGFMAAANLGTASVSIDFEIHLVDNI